MRLGVLAGSTQIHRAGFPRCFLLHCRALLGLDGRGRPSPYDPSIELPQLRHLDLRVCDKRRSVPESFFRTVPRPLARAAVLLPAAWPPPMREKACRKERPPRLRLPLVGTT